MHRPKSKQVFPLRYAKDQIVRSNKLATYYGNKKYTSLITFSFSFNPLLFVAHCVTKKLQINRTTLVTLLLTVMGVVFFAYFQFHGCRIQ